MGRRKVAYTKAECPHCKKYFGRNMLEYHIREKCVIAKNKTNGSKEKMLADRLEYVKTATFDDLTLTIGEIQKAGRLEEFQEYFKNITKPAE